MDRKKKTVVANPWELARAFGERYHECRDYDVGAVEVGILDIIDSVATMYQEVLPRIRDLRDASKDDLACELIDLKMDLEHIDYHARLAMRAIARMEKALNKVAEDGPSTAETVATKGKPKTTRRAAGR